MLPVVVESSSARRRSLLRNSVIAVFALFSLLFLFVTWKLVGGLSPNTITSDRTALPRDIRSRNVFDSLRQASAEVAHKRRAFATVLTADHYTGMRQLHNLVQ